MKVTATLQSGEEIEFISSKKTAENLKKLYSEIQNLSTEEEIRKTKNLFGCSTELVPKKEVLEMTVPLKDEEYLIINKEKYYGIPIFKKYIDNKYYAEMLNATTVKSPFKIEFR